jgi:hypothetical protein
VRLSEALKAPAPRKADPVLAEYMAILNGAEGVGRPLPSTSAVLGGLLAQEIIKVVSRRDVPLFNSVLLNSLTFQASVYELPKIKPKVEAVVAEDIIDL